MCDRSYTRNDSVSTENLTHRPKTRVLGWMARVLCRGGGGEDIQARRVLGGPRHGARNLKFLVLIIFKKLVSP
jgi:hypothetical protein